MAAVGKILSKRQKLAKRGDELRQKLDAALADRAELASVATLDAALLAVERAEDRIAQPRRATILLWLSAALMAVSLMGAGLYFTVPDAGFRLQAKAWAVTVTAAPTGAFGLTERPALSSFSAFDVDELRILSGNAASEERLPVERIEEVRIAKDTTFELVVQGEDCLLFHILSGSQINSGAKITMGVTSEAQSRLPPVAPRQLEPGDYAKFCGVESVDPFLIGSVDAVRLTRVYRDDAPRLEASTIVEGSLLVTDVGENRALLPTDRLVLEDMRSTNLVVRLADGALAITLDGRAADPRIFSGAPTLVGDKLLPSLLTYATSSPPALLLVMAIGLFGTLWNGLKLLKSWWKR